MNKRQRKKAVMKEVSRFYDVVFERNRFRKDLAIVCGIDNRFRKVLTSVMVTQTKYEWGYGEFLEISIDGYVADRKRMRQ